MDRTPTRTLLLVVLGPHTVARVLSQGGYPWIEIEHHYRRALVVWTQGSPS